MIKQVKSNARNMAFSTALAMLSPAQATAYEVDCAILLCLSGGWPASAECNHARAVFIQRITPWPIEPPLQIWRCPMGAAMNEGSVTTPGKRLRSLAMTGTPEAAFRASVSSDSVQKLGPVRAVFEQSIGEELPTELLHRVSAEIPEENGTADIDVSGPEFDFIRSIKVWDVQHYSHAPRGKEGDCREHSEIRLGSYGDQGEFRWIPTGPDPVPDWVIPSRLCRMGSYTRAVGVEWTDVVGNHGFEVVNY